MRSTSRLVALALLLGLASASSAVAERVERELAPRPERAEPAADQASATSSRSSRWGGKRRAEPAAAARAEELKQLWHERGILTLHADRVDVPRALDRLVRGVLAHGSYAVDVPRGQRGRRVIRPGAEVAVEVGLIGAAAAAPARAGEVRAADLAAAVTRVSDFARARELVLRPGADGVADLLADELVRDALVAGLGGERHGSPRGLVRALDHLAATARDLRLTAIDPLRLDRQPLELQLVVARDPDARAILADLGDRGVPLYLREVTTTPAAVLDAISLISIVSQENTTNRWIERLVRDDRPPDLAPTARGLERARALELTDADGQVAPARLARAVRLVERAADDMLRLEVGANAAGVTRDSPEIARLERALDPSRRELAARRLQFDNAQARTEEARGIIKKMIVLGPAAHVLESLDLGIIAKVLTGSADDVLGGIAELRSVSGSGFLGKELVRKGKLALPLAGVGAVGASALSELLLEHGNEVAAGGLFGASAVAISLTFAALSVDLYRQSYDELLRRGKVPGKVGPLMQRRFQRELKRVDRALGGLFKPEHRARLMTLIGESLDGEVASGALRPDQRDAIVADLGKLDLRAIEQQVRRDGAFKELKEAIYQDFSNPARLGLIMGALVAPIAGMVAAHAGLLHNGLVLAGVGSAESLVAGATVLGAHRLARFLYQRNQRAELARAQAP